jgi:hypothetical protein
MPRERSEIQRLIDICFSLVAMANDKGTKKLPLNEAMFWVSDQLKQCGFPTIPCGSCWGTQSIKYNEELYQKIWKGILEDKYD